MKACIKNELAHPSCCKPFCSCSTSSGKEPFLKSVTSSLYRPHRYRSLSAKLSVAMFLLSFLAISLLSSCATGKQCVNITIPISISARQGVFNVPTLQVNLDATVFSQNFTSIKANFTEQALTGYATITGEYNISAKFCKPNVMYGTEPTVQVLTHGIGFDKT